MGKVKTYNVTELCVSTSALPFDPSYGVAIRVALIAHPTYPALPT